MQRKITDSFRKDINNESVGLKYIFSVHAKIKNLIITNVINRELSPEREYRIMALVFSFKLPFDNNDICSRSFPLIHV